MTGGAFSSWRAFWHFRREVARERRFIRTPSTELFLASVAATLQSRVREIPVGWLAWRAQLGNDWRYEDSISDEVPSAYPPPRMKPLTDRAYEGRANPKGIPCLYLATSELTAISEVRPWIGSYVSVGQFRTTKSVRVVDCSQHQPRHPVFFKEPAPRQREQAVWAHINSAFAEPVTRSDDTAEYVATQILAELFRDQGYDGVAYKSAFGEDGHNVALFDIECAHLLNCTLHQVDGVTCRYSQADNTYFVTAEGLVRNVITAVLPMSSGTQ